MAQNVLERSFDSCIGKRRNKALELIESVKNYIADNDCPVMSMNISSLNLIEASKVVVLCSTYHYTKYPYGQFNWIVNSSEVKNIIKPLNLGNVNFITV